MASSRAKPKTHHILLEDAPGYFMPGPFDIASHVQPTNDYQVPVKKGTLVFIPSPDVAVQFLPEILVQSAEAESVYMRCNPGSIAEVSDREYGLLIAISQMFTRFKVYRDKAWLNEGSRLAVGDTVKFTGKTSTGQKGTIRYKGQLHTRQGTWFGLELAQPGHDDHYCDGVFGDRRYFKTKPKCGVFVTLGDIRLNKAKMRTAPAGTLAQERLQQRGMLNSTFNFGEGRLALQNEEFYEPVLHSESGMTGDIIIPRRRDARHKFAKPKETLLKENKSKLVKLLTRDNKKIIEVLVLQNVINEESSEVLHSVPGDEKRTQLLIDILGADAENTLGPFIEILDMLEKPFAANLLRESGGAKSDVLQELDNQVMGEGFDGTIEQKGTPPYQQIYDRGHFKAQRSTSLPEEHPGSPWVTPTRIPPKDNPEIAERGLEPPGAAHKGVYQAPEQKYTACTEKLGIGSMVEVTLNERIEYGVIKWLGRPNDSDDVVAGLELENAILNGNSGSIGSRKLFDCEAKKGQFILLKDCRPDRRFEMEENLETEHAKMLPIKQESAGNKRKPQPQQNKPTAFTVGSRVTVDILDTNRVGTIKWIGGSNPLKPWAGIEMEEDFPNGNNGFMGNNRLFFCLPRRGHFCLLSECQMAQNSDPSGSERIPSSMVTATPDKSNQGNTSEMSKSFMSGHQTDKNAIPMWKSISEMPKTPEPRTSTPKLQLEQERQPKVISESPEMTKVQTKVDQSPAQGTSLQPKITQSQVTQMPGNMTQSGVFVNTVQPKVPIPTSLDPWKIDTEFGLGSEVEITLSGKTHEGIIRWIGYTNNPDKPMAGLEMKEALARGNDGYLGPTRIFHCHPKQGLFLLLSKCRNIARHEEAPNPPQQGPVVTDAPLKTSTQAKNLQNEVQQTEMETPTSKQPVETKQELGPPPIMVDPRHIPETLQHFQLGTRVVVTVEGRDITGAIRWFGYQHDMKTLLAGLEMEEDILTGCDGTLAGTRIFVCAPKRGHITPLTDCRPKDKPTFLPEPVGLKEGSRIVVNVYAKKRSGVIRWIGTSNANSTKLLAGLEMDEALVNGNEGVLNNQQKFRCDPGRGLFVLLSKCQPEEAQGSMSSSSCVGDWDMHEENDKDLCSVEVDYNMNKEIKTTYIYQRDELISLTGKAALPTKTVQNHIKELGINIGGHVSNKPKGSKKNKQGGGTQSNRMKEVQQLTQSMISEPSASSESDVTRLMSQSVIADSSSPVSVKQQGPVPVDPTKLPPGLGLDSAVEVTLEGKPSLGIIKWVGQYGVDYIAGLEMMEELPNGNNGMIDQVQLFHCPPKKGIFTKLRLCKPIDLF